MLPARNRMRRGADYRVAVRTGRRVGRATLVLHVAVVANSQEPALVGFAVSRAVGSAVTRNRVKRRLREAVRERVGELPDGWLLVVRANPAAATGSWSALRHDLGVALSRALPRSVDGTSPPARHPRVQQIRGAAEGST